MFIFFLMVNRKEIITFCGSNIEVDFDPNGKSSKECFRLYEDGYYKDKKIVTRHPNILKSVIVGKKGWGLWLNQWVDGIVDWCFTKEEIFNEFKSNNVEIPDSFVKDFENRLEKLKQKRNNNYIYQLKEYYENKKFR